MRNNYKVTSEQKQMNRRKQTEMLHLNNTDRKELKKKIERTKTREFYKRKVKGGGEE